MARPRQVSDDEILSAVRSGVLEKGPQVSLDIIARRLNVTAPALFKRFGSRNALVLAALRPPDDPEFLALLAGEPDDRPLEAQLLEIMDAHMRFLDDIFPCLSALRESGIPREELKVMFKKGPFFHAVQAFAGWLQRAEKRGLCAVPDTEAVAMAIFGAGYMPVMIRHMQKHTGGTALRLDNYTRLISGMVSRGLKRKRTS